jgi:hypothetical protein
LQKDIVASAGANGNGGSRDETAAEAAAVGFTPTELKHTSKLPRWIRNYIAWHKAMIRKVPGHTDILTNPDAPKILVRVCLGLCGGLHDRLRSTAMGPVSSQSNISSFVFKVGTSQGTGAFPHAQ